MHEMIFGYGAAVVAGFLLTAIPNWTGRMPLQGGPLAVLVGLLAVFAVAVAREIVTRRNWRNLPMLIALALLLTGNLLVHLDALGVAATAELGNRIGVATLLMLISFVGGRIIPSFTRNWLSKERREISTPATFSTIDRAVLAPVALALMVWASDPDLAIAPWLELVAGAAIFCALPGGVARRRCGSHW